MSDSNNRARNDDDLKFAIIVSQKSQLGFLVVEVDAEQAFASGILWEHFPITLIFYYFIWVKKKGILVKPPYISLIFLYQIEWRRREFMVNWVKKKGI